MHRNLVEADCPDVGLHPSHHQLEKGLAVPGRRDLRLAEHLVRAGHFVVVPATRHEPRTNDVAVLVDRPHALAGTFVDETPTFTRVRGQGRCVGTGRGDRRQRKTHRILCPGGRGRRAHDVQLFVGPDAEDDRRLATDFSVDEQGLFGLHRDDRLAGGSVEHPVRCALQPARANERFLHARDGCARVTRPQSLRRNRAVVGNFLLADQIRHRGLADRDRRVGHDGDGCRHHGSRLVDTVVRRPNRQPDTADDQDHGEHQILLRTQITRRRERLHFALKSNCLLRIPRCDSSWPAAA